MARAALLMLLLLPMAACAPVLSVGSPCVRNSECPSPLGCIAGRCREQCVDHRDCAAPNRCLVGTDGVGSCALPEERCDSENPCPEDLLCDANACFDRCVAASCPAGGECSGGLCVRPSGTDAGADAPTTTDAPPTTDAPSFGREACRSDADCGAMQMCGRILGGQLVCRERCAMLGDCVSGGTTTGCVLVESAAGGAASACALPCDLFAPSSGCPSGEACDVIELNTAGGRNAVVVDCRPLDPAMRVQDGPCADGSGGWDPTLCAAGYVCDGTGPGYTCQTLCTVGGTLGPMCPMGTSCEAFGVIVRFGGASIGSCDPT